MPLNDPQNLSGNLSEGDTLGGTAGVVAQLRGSLVSTSSLGATLANASVLRGTILTPGDPAARDFLGLSDTPDSYAGFGGYFVAVNDGEDALEFVAASAAQGAKGDKGDKGDTGPAGADGTGGSGSGDLNYIFSQLSAATTWAITHNLGKFPSVSVVDSAGTVVMGDVTYSDDNSLTVHFTAAFAGKAFLN